MIQRLYLAHTATHWAAIVASSHAEARALCKQDDVTVLSCGEAVGQDVRGNFGRPRWCGRFGGGRRSGRE